MYNRFVFIHIPKTAGTSFRKGLEQSVGREAIFYDYGVEAVAKNKLLISYLYDRSPPDFFGFRAELDNYHNSIVCGHYQAKKYFPYFTFGQLGTFFRDPVNRTISEYLHFRRVNGYKGSIEEFCENPIFQNRQSYFMQGVSLDSLGFIGITERYNDSIRLFADHTGIVVPPLELNAASTYPDEITSDVYEYVKQFNHADSVLYAEALSIFEERLKRLDCHENSPELTYQSSMRILNSGLVQGWVVVEKHPECSPFYYVLHNERVIQKFKANEYRLDLKKQKYSRSGSIGFSFKVDTNSLNKGDVLILSHSTSIKDEINRIKIND